MSEPSRTSRIERVLHDELDDSKPPALHRKYNVNPQEAHGVLTTVMQPNPYQQLGTPSATSPHHSIRLPGNVPRPESSVVRPATRVAGRRLALEEDVEQDSNFRPVHPPERKQRDESQPATIPQPSTGEMKPPAFVQCRKRTSLRSNSDGSASPTAVPVPPPLTYNETMHTSNKTTTATATTPSTTRLSGEDSLVGSELSVSISKPRPRNSQLQQPAKPPHPWTVLRLQQNYPLMPMELSSLEEETSSRSNSLRTRSTMDTLELVLAHRYPVDREIPSQNQGDHDNYQISGGTSDPVYLLPNQHHSQPSEAQSSCGPYSEGMIQLLLDEKRRQAGGYISQDLDAYIYNQSNVEEAEIFGYPSATQSPSFDWRDVDDHHRNFTNGHADHGETDTVGDASLSTAPDPPSLRVREHLALRPGAYRMSHGGFARHVDNDSVASSSLQTYSTLRTVVDMGIIEGVLVVDEPLPKDEEEFGDDDEAMHRRRQQHGNNNCRDDNNPNCITAGQIVHDSECPSPPATLSFEISTGDVTFFSGTSASTPIPLVLARSCPTDDNKTFRVFFQGRKVRCMLCLLTLVCASLALGIVYAVTGFASFVDGDPASTTPITNGSSIPPPLTPTTPGDLQLTYFVDVALPEYTKIALNNPNSPQSQALEWLRNNTNLESYPVGRRLQRFTLATLYYATGGMGRWISDDNWLSDLDECSWYSTVDANMIDYDVCVDNDYRVLALQKNQLLGMLPPEIELLSSLELIQLDENRLSGFIPVTLGRMSNLKELHLFDNYLSGTIPFEIGSLTNLEVLNLEYNFLAQSLPSTLGLLSSLRILLLDRNNFVGSIPTALAQLTKLEVLHMYNNYFTGQIPSELEALSNLFEILLDFNRLSGSIPPIGESWSKLDWLNLANNTLTGSLPTEIGEIGYLTHLDVSLNQLYGSIPSEVGNLLKLKFLFMEENSLNGWLPTEIGNMNNITVLLLHSNQLTGAVPSQIGQLTNLEGLSLSNNLFNGGLPTEIGLLTNMRTMSVDSNYFIGSVPSELGLLTNALTIQLHNNGFTGTMPREVCELVDNIVFPLANVTVNCMLVNCSCCVCQ